MFAPAAFAVDEPVWTIDYKKLNLQKCGRQRLRCHVKPAGWSLHIESTRGVGV